MKTPMDIEERAEQTLRGLKSLCEKGWDGRALLVWPYLGYPLTTYFCHTSYPKIGKLFSLMSKLAVD
jgi:hypothetical protein